LGNDGKEAFAENLFTIQLLSSTALDSGELNLVPSHSATFFHQQSVSVN
jgi:hypothetical protein